MALLRSIMHRSRSPRLVHLAKVTGAGWLSMFAAVSASHAARVEAGRQQPAPVAQKEPESLLNIRADSQEKDKNLYHLRGHVEVTYQDTKLTADEATYDTVTGDITARGQVIYTDPDAHLEAEEAQYNVLTRKGTYLKVRGYFRASVRPRPRMLVTENPFYLQARKVEQLDRDTYLVHDGRVSSCECESKGWSVATSQARVKVDDKVVARGDVFRLVRVPLFYFPVFVSSISRTPRQTGFLLPHIGNSSQKGLIVGGGFFWAINPSADLLLGVENYSIRGLSRSGRFRARPSSTSEIRVDYYGVNDRGSGPLRQLRAPGDSLRAVGQAKDLGHGFRGVVDVDYITSLAFRQTFSDNFTQAVTSELHQTGFLTKSFDAYSLNFYASRYQNFLCAAPVSGTSTTPGSQNCPAAAGATGNSIAIRQTPSVSFSGTDQQVGRAPLYFSFDASAAGMGRTEPSFRTPALSERLDFLPTLTLRSRPFWGFRLTPSTGLRLTRYGTSLRPDRSPLSRILGEASLDLRPPSLEKIFPRPFRGYKFKHVVESEVRYSLVRAQDARDLQDVVRFDQTDILAETNEVEYSLTNSLFTRKEVEGSGETPQARELLSLRLSEKYYFDPTFGGVLQPGKNVFDPAISLTGFAFAKGRRLSPVVSVLKFAPFSTYDTELRADFSPTGGGVLNAGITSHFRRGPVGMAFTDFFINRTASFPTPVTPTGPPSSLPSFNLLRAVATYGDISRKGLSGAFGVDYNFAQGIAHQVVSQLSYNFGCFALDFEFRRFALGTLRREHVFRVALSLANVGTFGNLKPRERLY